MSPELITAVITGGIGAFTGLSRALNNFNKKIEKRFEGLEQDYESLYNKVTKEYVLKEDFRREIGSVHTKLDRIIDHLLSH